MPGFGHPTPMIASAADLRTPEPIGVGPSEVVYAFVSVDGELSPVDDALLDDEERARSMRFFRPSDRRRFVLAHAALRLLLARCLEIPPKAVRYETGVHGKPRLGPGLPPLEFNMSHSGRLAMLAVTQDGSVGVDVEYVRDVPDALSIADMHFSTAEQEVLRSLPQAELRDAFFRCWTRKEAVIKAFGEGLNLPLDSFDVSLDPGATSEINRSDGGRGDTARWSLRDVAAPPGYVAAGANADALGAPSLPWRALSIDVPKSAKSSR
jgi:4'-phosphopantetheinyl transferase